MGNKGIEKSVRQHERPIVGMEGEVMDWLWGNEKKDEYPRLTDVL